MFYEKRVVVPPLTTASEPVSQELLVHPGTVEQVEISFPAGCAALVGLKVFYWEHQIWPTNLEEDFRGDGELIRFAEDFELPGPPFRFRLVATNEDDTYQHQLLVRLKVAPLGDTLKEILLRSGIGPTGPVSRSEG